MTDCRHRIFWHKDGYRAEICVREDNSAVQITKSHDEKQVYILVLGSIEAFIQKELIGAEFVEVNARLEEDITN